MFTDRDAGLSQIGVNQLKALHASEKWRRLCVSSPHVSKGFRRPRRALTYVRATDTAVLEQLAFRLYCQLGLPQRLTAMDRIIKIQSTRHAERADLAFIDLCNAINEIGDA